VNVLFHDRLPRVHADDLSAGCQDGILRIRQVALHLLIGSLQVFGCALRSRRTQREMICLGFDCAPKPTSGNERIKQTPPKD
jgi:hypothetical protein